MTETDITPLAQKIVHNDVHDSGVECTLSDPSSGDEVLRESLEDATFSKFKNEMSQTFVAEDFRSDSPPPEDNNRINSVENSTSDKEVVNNDSAAPKDISDNSEENNNPSNVPQVNGDDTIVENDEQLERTVVEVVEMPQSNSNQVLEPSCSRPKRSTDRRCTRKRSGRNRSRVRSRSRTPIRRHQSHIIPDRMACRVFVANIPFSVTWQDLKQLFQDRIGNVEFVTLFTEQNGDSRGCGLVDFSNADSASSAIEKMNKLTFRNRKLVVKSDLGKERDNTGRIISNSGRPAPLLPTNGLPTYGHETYGLSFEFLNKIGVSPPLSDRVFVANIKYSVHEKNIEEMFSMAGTIRKILLARDKFGKSRGFGTIQYCHPIEAVQAVSMFNSQIFYERPITVRMDRCDSNRAVANFPPNHAGLPLGLGTIGQGLGVGGAPLQISRSNSVQSMNNRYHHPHEQHLYERNSVDLDAHYQQYPNYRSPNAPTGPPMYPPSNVSNFPNYFVPGKWEN